MNDVNVGIKKLDFTFMFWAYRKIGNPVHLTFKVDSVAKFVGNVAVLKGEVVFGQSQIDGDIMVEFKMQNDGQYVPIVSCKQKKDRYKYVLKPDVRTEEKWNALVKELFDSLSSR